jgi:predicted nucleotidyltransferase
MTVTTHVDRSWIERLPDDLHQHASVLGRLFDVAHADLRIRAFSLRGSVARGQGDALSDLDTRVWIRDDEFDEAISGLPVIARAVGEPLDILFETPGSPFLFIQYAAGVQVELFAVRTSEISEGVQPQIVLFDRDGMLRDAPEEPPPFGVPLWTGWAAMRLYNLDKYLRRNEIWRAYIHLQDIRNLLLFHYAALVGVPDPELGLTSLRDYNGALPPRLEETVALFDPGDIRRAALVCAELLADFERRPFTNLVLSRLQDGAS